MRAYGRDIFALLAVGCFATTASGLALLVHLSHLDEPTEHDADECSLCQQAFVSAKHYVTAPEPVLIDSDPAGYIVSVRWPTRSHQSPRSRFDPRAPPAS
jgi:hypothetical protein